MIWQRSELAFSNLKIIYDIKLGIYSQSPPFNAIWVLFERRNRAHSVSDLSCFIIYLQVSLSIKRNQINQLSEKSTAQIKWNQLQHIKPSVTNNQNLPDPTNKSKQFEGHNHRTRAKWFDKDQNLHSQFEDHLRCQVRRIVSITSL